MFTYSCRFGFPLLDTSAASVAYFLGLPEAALVPAYITQRRAGRRRIKKSIIMMDNVVVVAVDESEQSLAACDWACKHLLSSSSPSSESTQQKEEEECVVDCDSGSEQQSTLVLLHVQPLPCFSAGPAYIVGNETMRLLEMDTKRRTERVMKRALQVCKRYGMEGRTRTHVVAGDAKQTICNTAAKLGAQMLVMGTTSTNTSNNNNNNAGQGQALGGFLVRLKSLRLRDSVSEYCSRKAECPVIVVNNNKVSSC